MCGFSSVGHRGRLQVPVGGMPKTPQPSKCPGQPHPTLGVQLYTDTEEPPWPSPIPVYFQHKLAPLQPPSMFGILLGMAAWQGRFQISSVCHVKPRTSSMARSLCVSLGTISIPAAPTKTDVRAPTHGSIVENKPQQGSFPPRAAKHYTTGPEDGNRSENARAGCGSARLLHFEVPTGDLIMEDDVIIACL
ncbi:hypothetical protein BT67DRAFT_493726 [Trichocladium antarcticum]|uniref:Uncharacterized protein n=1 Tax=Trichocladium antarcticum TaxID=1450529 RepID=A0AAN6UMT4_9PEZI|nr:hypothetical protein BT67DRAFT_493726 [Trichocladium antarcticum]